MIRKLKSGRYRLYSRKKNAKTGKRRNLGTFPVAPEPCSVSARFSTSSAGTKHRRPGYLSLRPDWRAAGSTYVIPPRA